MAGRGKLTAEGCCELLSLCGEEETRWRQHYGGTICRVRLQELQCFTDSFGLDHLAVYIQLAIHSRWPQGERK